MEATGVSAQSLSSTIDLASAGKHDWDVIVVGGGLAGSVSARGLAAAGFRTLLVDRSSYPRPKVCGCCITSLAAETLDSIGLGHVLGNCGARQLSEVHLYAGSTPTAIPIRGVVGLSREALDTQLAREAVEAGASLLLETRADPSSDGQVTLCGGTETVQARARAVVLAAGLRSHQRNTPKRASRTLVGIGAVVPDSGHNYPDGVVRMVIDQNGYVGIAPLEDGRLTIASAIRADAIQRTSPKSAVEDILKQAKLERLVTQETRFTGVPALKRQRSRVQEGRLLAVGDAAGFVEPITGEGMSWAIATGAAVVRSASSIIEGTARENEWQVAYRRMMPRRHIRCAFVGACIRRPALVRAAIAASSVVPMIRGTVLSGLLGRYDPSIEGELT